MKHKAAGTKTINISRELHDKIKHRSNDEGRVFRLFIEQLLRAGLDAVDQYRTGGGK